MYDDLRVLEEQLQHADVNPSLAKELSATAARLRTQQGTCLPPKERSALLTDRLRQQLVEATAYQQRAMASCWNSRQRKLAERLQHNATDDFLRWPETRFIQSSRHGEARALLKLLRADPDWPSRWSRAVTENQVGKAWPLSSEPAMSPNSVLLTSHLWQYERASGLKIDRDIDLIVEFGGGYGAMCRVAHESGFSGRYIIFDLPVISALQRYYLSSVGLPVLPQSKLLASAESGVACISSLTELQNLLSEKQSASDQPQARLPRSLFIATWSLSETPLSVRNEFHSVLERFSAYLLSYAIAFEDCDNRTYYRQLISEPAFAALSWHEQRLPSQPLNYYLFGYPSQGAPPSRSLLDETLFEAAAKRLILLLNWSLI